MTSPGTDGGFGGGALGFDAALRELGQALAAKPEAALGAWQRFATDCMTAGIATMSSAAGGKGLQGLATPVEPARGDRRFKDTAWRENPVYSGLMQGYLLWSRLMRELVEAAGLDRATERKASFAVESMIDALAPTNTLLGNPAALRRAFETGGGSLARGAEQFLDDLVHNDGMPKQVDRSAVKLGENMAATPGQVVFRNDLIELIQFAPQTKTVHPVPLLLSPPWINKYYVMDLAPKKSLVEWAVTHGHTVFAISYVNPGPEHRDTAFEDYLRSGPLAALDVVESITGAAKINVGALCLGGTLAAIMAGYLTAQGDKRINTLTMMNTLLDFAEPGVLGAFVDTESLSVVDEQMREKGYLEARSMAGTFNAMRANDLIWNYVVSGWLMGEPPPAFDLLAWNADATRMPARMHAEYLRTCYVENRLARGTMKMLGRRIDLKRVDCDVYYVAAEEDHITPWRSCYASSRLFGGDVRFALSSSGHIAGVVNPPDGRRTLRVGADHVAEPEAWYASTTPERMSWWQDWAPWLKARSGRRGAPPPLGNEDYPPLGDAPGTYVLAT
jgi:polyhydroxyalkanoate synthase subunit PhaC